MQRSSITFTALVWIGLLGAPNCLESAASAVGMVIQATGQVFVLRGTSKTEVRLADLLYPGDVLLTGTGEAVVMYCPSSQRLTIPKNATVELQADGIKVIKGAAPAKTPANCLLPRVALGSESLERVGAFRARGHAPIVQYLGGPITTRRPTFVWGPVARATTFRISLKEAERDLEIWNTRTASLSVSYPESMPALEGGPYEWEVRAEAGDEILAQGTATFETKPNADLSRTPETGPEAELMHALELEAAGYYAEAAAFFRKLQQADPKDARIIRHLAWLYWNAGLIEAFNEEWRRLGVK